MRSLEERRFMAQEEDPNLSKSKRCELLFVHRSGLYYISNAMSSQWCQQVTQEAIDKYGKPEIFNTDQGGQFTSERFIKLLKDNNIKISMDGKGRVID